MISGVLSMNLALKSMINQENLEQIKLANNILNRSSRRLGVKPMLVDQEIKQKPQKITDVTPEIKSVSTKLINESQCMVNSRKQKNSLGLIYVLLALIVIVLFMLILKPMQTNAQGHLTDAIQPIGEIRDRSLIICSGSFVDKNSASKYQRELKDRLGVPLKIIKTDNSFTVQIGPEYPNQDDAMLVFDELSRYSVRNLALKFVS